MTPPKWDEWPYYPIIDGDGRFTNGREAGCWAAGVINAIPEKCGIVEIPNDYLAGALVAMVENGLNVEAYTHSENRDRRSLRVRSAWVQWLPIPDTAEG